MNPISLLMEARRILFHALQSEIIKIHLTRERFTQLFNMLKEFEDGYQIDDLEESPTFSEKLNTAIRTLKSTKHTSSGLRISTRDIRICQKHVRRIWTTIIHALRLPLNAEITC
ncbi:MAG: hypothetical protein ACTSRS_09995 [Candidatus Helarchaeota archaeon]